MKSSILVAAVFAANLSCAEFANATPIVIDQQQPAVDLTVGGLGIGGGSNSEQMLAQVVTAGISGVLTEVRLPVGADSGDLIVEIESVTGGRPNGVVLASESFPAATLPPVTLPPDFVRLPFDSPTAFLAGDAFAIVLRTGGSFGIFQGPPGNSYQGGDAYFDARPNPPGWVPLGPPTFDLPFQTVVQPTAVPEPQTLSMVGTILGWLSLRSRGRGVRLRS